MYWLRPCKLAILLKFCGSYQSWCLIYYLFWPGAPLLALFLQPCVRICSVAGSSSTVVITRYTTGKSTLKDARLPCAVKCARNDSTGTSTRPIRSRRSFTLPISLPSLVAFAVKHSWIAPSTTNTTGSCTLRQSRTSVRYVPNGSRNKVACNNTCECIPVFALLFAHFAQKHSPKKLGSTNIFESTQKRSRSSVWYAASVSPSRFISDNICALTLIYNHLSVPYVGENSSKAAT